MLSVGYIVGLNIAILIFLGGLFNWAIAIPICALLHDWPAVDNQPISALEFAGQLWSEKTRYIGVGAMLVGGIWTVFKLRTSIFSGITSGLDAYRTINKSQVKREDRDIPMKWVIILIVGSIMPLFVLYQVLVKDISVALPMAIIMVATGFLFSAVAGYMAGLVGSSNNPVSGITIATVLVASLLLVLLMGKTNPNGPSAAIIIGSVVCCAAAIAGDNMQDLKAGRIVGATPYKQQIMQIVGTVSAALVMAPVLTLLLKAYGFAGHSSATDNALMAPQANLIAAVAKGVFEGGLPWDFISIGVVLAIIVIIVDCRLEKKNSSFRMPILAVAIGVYLPLSLEVPIVIGGLIHQAVLYVRKKRNASNDTDSLSSHGLLFASGLITGEALIGILLAIPIVISGRPDVLQIFRDPSEILQVIMPIAGIMLFAAIAAWLYRTALKD